MAAHALVCAVRRHCRRRCRHAWHVRASGRALLTGHLSRLRAPRTLLLSSKNARDHARSREITRDHARCVRCVSSARRDSIYRIWEQLENDAFHELVTCRLIEGNLSTGCACSRTMNSVVYDAKQKADYNLKIVPTLSNAYAPSATLFVLYAGPAFVVFVWTQHA